MAEFGSGRRSPVREEDSVGTQGRPNPGGISGSEVTSAASPEAAGISLDNMESHPRSAERSPPRIDVHPMSEEMVEPMELFFDTRTDDDMPGNQVPSIEAHARTERRHEEVERLRPRMLRWADSGFVDDDVSIPQLTPYHPGTEFFSRRRQDYPSQETRNWPPRERDERQIGENLCQGSPRPTTSRHGSVPSRDEPFIRADLSPWLDDGEETSRPGRLSSRFLRKRASPELIPGERDEERGGFSHK
jgi:hypothetical protein